jgi:peptidoglycan/LPS O-acetylase OafA/YrhL
MDRVKGIDGLRALSVLMVFGTHAKTPFMSGGMIGVEVFFVISGFVITRSLIAEYQSTGRVDIPAFYARRALRLWPALIAMVVPFSLIFAMHSDEWLPALFYFSNFTLPEYPRVFLHTWSLALEEQFYLLWPLAFVLLVGRCPLAMLVAISTLATLWAGYAYLTDPYFNDLEFRPDLRMSPLFIGCALAFTSETWLRRLGFLWPFALVALIWMLAFKPTHLTMLPPIPEAAAVLIAKVATDQQGRLTRLLEWAPLAGLGVISYAVYLWHLPVLRYLGWSFGAWGCLILAIALAWASWILIERPMRRNRTRLISFMNRGRLQTEG